MSIAEFLLARFAEDEAEARQSVYSPGPHRVRQSRFILAECDAKRRIVEEAQRAWRRPSDDPMPEGTEWLLGQRQGLHRALQLLAQPYADHPDYRQEWRFGLRSMTQCGATNPETDRACVLPGRHDGMHQTEVGTWFGERP